MLIAAVAARVATFGEKFATRRRQHVVGGEAAIFPLALSAPSRLRILKHAA
jgi:hypothetical protein